MNRLYSAVLVAILGFGSICSFAADLSGDERSELRQRADAFQAERARNPSFEPGDGRLARERDVGATRQPGELKARHAKPSKRAKAGKAGKAGKAKRATKATKATKAKKAMKTRSSHRKRAQHKRSVRNLPGALVR